LPHRYNSTFWKQLGDSYVRKSRYDSAIYSYKVALKYDPDNRQVYNNLGYAYQKAGNEEEARKVKKRLAEWPEKTDQVVQQEKRSRLEDPRFLFFIFFAVVWGLLFLSWYNLLQNTSVILGMPSTGILALLITAWGWVFFSLWDSDTTITRIVALIITAVIGGLILLLFRRTYTWILDIG
jgi:tetratricopeptide (TPR) repeat protein